MRRRKIMNPAGSLPSGTSLKTTIPAVRHQNRGSVSRHLTSTQCKANQIVLFDESPQS